MNRDELIDDEKPPLNDEERAEFERVLIEGYELAKSIVRSPALHGSSVSVVLTGLATAYAFAAKRCGYPINFAMNLMMDRLKFVDEHVVLTCDEVLVNTCEPSFHEMGPS